MDKLPSTFVDRSSWLCMVEQFVKESEVDRLDLRGEKLDSGEVISVLKFLQKSQVTELDLSYNDLKDTVKDFVIVLPETKIRKLHLNFNSLTKLDFSLLINILNETDITDLSVSDNRLKLDPISTLELVSCLKKSKLTALDFSFNHFSPPDGAALFMQALPNLSITHLNLQGISGLEGGFKSYNAILSLLKNLRFSELRFLNLSLNNIGRPELTELGENLRLSKLEKLDLSNNKIDDVGLNLLAAALIHSKIVHLDLQSNEISGRNDFGSHLPDTNIKFLDLSNNFIIRDFSTSKMFTPANFLRNSSLVALKLSSCNLDESVGSQLMECLKDSKIEKLDLASNFLFTTVSDFVKIVKFTNITHLDFSGNHMRLKAFVLLGRCLKVSKITHINVSSFFMCHVGDTTHALDEFLENTKNTSVVSVDLSLNDFKPRDAEAIAENLEGTTFTHFNLAHNKFKDGAWYLIRQLKFSSITHLNLAANKIKDEGAKALAESLRETQIVKLDIHYNSITSRGAKTLAVALRNTNLLNLDLSENKIGMDGVKFLAEQIENTFITVLDVRCNPGSEQLPDNFLDSVLLKNKKRAQVLIKSFKRIAPKTNSSFNLQFDQYDNVSNFVPFCKDCLILYKTILEQPFSTSVLVQEESLNFSESQIITLMEESFPRQFTLFVGGRAEIDIPLRVDILRYADELGLKKVVELLFPVIYSHKPECSAFIYL